MESVLKLARQVFFYIYSFTNTVLLTYYFSISMRPASHNETNSLEDNCHSTETL